MSAKHHRKARGGKTGEPEVPGSGETAKTHPQKYDAQGSEEVKEVEDEKESFKKGGKTMKKGGVAEGKKAHHRPDRKHRASGGRTGGSPYTEAHNLKGPESSKNGQGHEDDGYSGRELSD